MAYSYYKTDFINILAKSYPRWVQFIGIVFITIQKYLLRDTDYFFKATDDLLTHE